MECRWEPYKNGKWRCMNPQCMRITSDPNCVSECIPRPPSDRLTDEQTEAAFTILGYSIAQISHWKKDVRTWWKADRPKRTDEEVAAILEICRSNVCGIFNEKAQQCGVCGCNVNDSRFAVFNAARMGSKRCPRGLW